MKKSIAIVTTLVSALAISGSALADEQRHEIGTDLLYGNTAIEASLGEAYVYNGPVREELSEYVFDNVESAHTHEFVAWAPQQTERQEISTDLIYGS